MKSAILFLMTNVKRKCWLFEKFGYLPLTSHFITNDVIEHEKWKMKSAILFLMTNVKRKCWLFEKFGLHHKIDHSTTKVSFFKR